MLASQISLDRQADEGLVRQLFVQIRQMIATGHLRSGTRLPPSRQLARDLGIGRNSVLLAYEQLLLEGYLQADGRRGTRVSAASRGFERANDPIDAAKHVRAPRLSRAGQALMAVDRRDRETPHVFQPGLPEIRAFPHDLWGRYLRRATRRLQGQALRGGYLDYSGAPELKKALIDHVSVSRGVVAEPGQVMILSSAQACIDLVVRLLIDPGDVALHEEPGYAGMLGPLWAAQGRGLPIPIEAASAPGAALKDPGQGLAAAEDPRLIYVTPSHQYPTGLVMGLDRRLSLLAYAHEHGAFVLEDDYDSEFHFSGAPLSCLQGLDRHQQVIYMGTFSKSLMPALHVAYLILPNCLVEPMRRSLRNVGAVPSLAVQLALADFLAEGHFRSHLRDMTRLYSERRNRLVEQLNAKCGAFLVPSMPDGGIQLPAYLSQAMVQRGIEDQALVRELAREGIECSSLSSLYWSGSVAARQGLLLGYAASNLDEIDKGVDQMAGVLNRLALDLGVRRD